MNIDAVFVTSATGASDLPSDERPEVALVGRSNVGKSSLINALTRQRIARASAAPGKTRLANVYRVRRGRSRPFYLVDLPGYGYARGGHGSAREFEELTRAYFGQARPAGRASQAGLEGQAGRASQAGLEGQARRARQAGQARNAGASPPGLPALPALPAPPGLVSAILLVDARHPGLDSDVEAWSWLKDTVAGRVIVATKIDKLPRGRRIRAMRELESVFDDSVLPVSAVTGEGLDELWNQIDRLVNSPNPQPRRSRSSHPPSRATAAPPPKN